MKRSHVYTRGGDSGATSLIGGKRIDKCDLQIETYGTLDELSAHIGLLATMVESFPEADVCFLHWIQSRLFDAGTHLAMPYTKGQSTPCAITSNHTGLLEEHIDKIDTQLPPLHAFILPGGCMAAAQSHVCRTVCRRAERLIAAFACEAFVCPDLQSFINRLSDFLFVYARFLNKLGNTHEKSWQKDCD